MPARLRLSLLLLLATCAISGVVIYVWPDVVLRRAENLLKRAYQVDRPFLFRLPSSGYGAVRVGTQSRAAGEAVALLRSQEFRLHQRSPYHLLLGRAAMLLGDAGAAVRHYSRALEIDASALEAKTELAGAYLVRSEREHRAVDVALALQLMGEAHGFRPVSALHSCNLAAILERIPAPHLAAEEWGRCEALEMSAEWKREASDRRGANERLIAERRRRGEAAESPSGFLHESAQRPFPPEFALEQAVASWLPRRDSDRAAEQVLSIVAGELLARHGDSWLAELLRSRDSRALGLLSTIALANRTGDYERAKQLAPAAIDAFRLGSNRAGELRARLEQIYALQRLEQGWDCLKAVRPLGRELEGTQFVWVRMQAALEESTCRSKTETSAALRTERERLLKKIEGTGYGGLALRAMGFLAQPELARANPVALWSLALDGLSRFWSGDYPFARAQQFYIATALASRGSLLPLAGIAMAREGTRVMESIPNSHWRALCLNLQGAMETDAEWFGDASETFVEARKLFDRSPQTAAVRLYRKQAELHRVVAEAQVSADAKLVPELREMLAGNSVPRHAAIAGQALAYVAFRSGDVETARRSLETVLRSVEAEIAGSADQSQRDAWVQQSGLAFRTQAELLLRTDKNADAAMESLLRFRAARNPVSRVRGRSVSGGGGAVLAIARLLSGTAVMASRGGKTAWRWLDGGRERTLRAQAKLFALLCASPGSDMDEIRRAGYSVYREVVEPFEVLLEGAEQLGIAAEGDFNAIPWAALPDRNGRFLLHRLPVFLSSDPRRVPARDLGLRGSSGLVAAEPAVSPATNGSLPPLGDARAEAKVIAGLFPRAEILSGREATVEELKGKLPRAAFFHFGGHGYANGGYGALLMSPGPMTPDGVLAAETIARLPLRDMRLVFLAACSSAVGESAGPVNPESLVRAFLDAGAARVLAALWDIPSTPTRRLSERFYQRLRVSGDPVEALHSAQLGLSAEATGGHPYYWAALQMYSQGNDQER